MKRSGVLPDAPASVRAIGGPIVATVRGALNPVQVFSEGGAGEGPRDVLALAHENDATSLDAASVPAQRTFSKTVQTSCRPGMNARR